MVFTIVGLCFVTVYQENLARTPVLDQGGLPVGRSRITCCTSFGLSAACLLLKRRFYFFCRCTASFFDPHSAGVI